MQPYGSFYFFIIIGILLIPSIIFGLKGILLRKYNAFLTLLMLSIIFSEKPREAIMLLLFIIWQYILNKSYLIVRKRDNNTITFYIAVILSILPLLIIKLEPFALGFNFFNFMGASYVTFRAVQMVFEVRDGLIKEVAFFNFWEFVLFFPAISIGPVDRYRRFQKGLQKPPSTEEYQDMLYRGINRIFQGFLYKYILAHLLKLYFVDSTVLKDETILYMYSYSLHLFFDFAGYSSFVIGISYLMGIKTPENFNKPFISRNIKDFWNRWHMSVSFWFRDFIYMRFVLFLTKNKLLKNRYTISYIGAFLNFFIMGIWHIQGNAVTQYIIYGLYHAVLFILFDIFERKNKKYKFWPNNKFTHIISIIFTFHFVCFGFLIFSGYLWK
ncbi:D-alanyl-lipoteichoic acid biosynthesis protein DltB [Bacillus thuringiensis]|uniref:Teichoic acid D-alanyltransferase n=1 Tax=Bacillus thuringiensis Bt18247 TaxID=1423143 RepID=A0A9W3XBW2_BACTU|nr:D-alanyl-lipoteichoic acid biosynthesis protein DltB [Bacillus thuringiensis]AOM14299.1 protein DltB [Bacillus thuringiensis Bt18247]MBG9529329.1 alanine transporter [Bacillus thuringiensis]